MATSRAKFAVVNSNPARRGCSAHGTNICDNDGVWMLAGEGLTYPACQKFLEEHPEIEIRENRSDQF